MTSFPFNPYTSRNVALALAILALGAVAIRGCSPAYGQTTLPPGVVVIPIPDFAVGCGPSDVMRGAMDPGSKQLSSADLAGDGTIEVWQSAKGTDVYHFMPDGTGCFLIRRPVQGVAA